MAHLCRATAKSSRRTRRWAIVSLVSIAATSSSQPLPALAQIADQMERSQTLADSVAGTERDVVTRAGIPPPDLTNPAAPAYLLEGSYRWYVRGNDWWTVKAFPYQSPGYGPVTRMHIAKNYEDQVLSYDEIRKPTGELYFTSAHLDRSQELSCVGPMLGRRDNIGPLAKIVRNLTDARIVESVAGIEIDGSYDKGRAHFTVEPRHDYLATSFVLSNGVWRAGFRITKVCQVGKTWMPETADRFNGEYKGDRLAKGYEDHVEFADFALHPAPTRDEVPTIPAGAMMGSEDNRLYRVAQDGTLVDFGRQGFKPGGGPRLGRPVRLLGGRAAPRFALMARVPKTKVVALAVGLATLGCGSRPSAPCGVASLVNVLGRASAPVRYADLRSQTAVADGHTTFADLAQAAARRGVAMRGYRLESPRLIKGDDLGVVELIDDHFVALVGRRGEAFLIVDSPDGTFREPAAWSAARLESEWTGNVLLVERPPR